MFGSIELQSKEYKHWEFHLLSIINLTLLVIAISSVLLCEINMQQKCAEYIIVHKATKIYLQYLNSSI